MPCLLREDVCAYDVLYVHTGQYVCSQITLGMYVSHAAAPSAWLDFVLPCLESRAQIVRCLATERFARRTNSLFTWSVKDSQGREKQS